jgi:hypothetical protein
MWLRGNAPEFSFFPARNWLTPAPPFGNELCVMSVTPWPGQHGESEMNYLSHVVDQRPMLLVSGQILLAFCCATPLVLLLCFLI